MSDPRRVSAAEFCQAVRGHPIIASVKDAESLDLALDGPTQVLFLMYGELLDLEATVERIRGAGRTVFVDVDLLEGFAGRPVVIDLVQASQADGIVSAKTSMVKAAKDHGLTAGHRFVLADTRTYRSIPTAIEASGADFIEAQPGCVPRLISWLREEIPVPIVAGGLVFDRQDVRAALDAGALAVATSNARLWDAVTAGASDTPLMASES
ncbi:MAG: glycerol-3-phosphate responsive antiterminator [Micrococcales bacterium]|nr:glycerol-3-phosphate responsive antiterminator [Micrococcales bacterium]